MGLRAAELANFEQGNPVVSSERTRAGGEHGAKQGTVLSWFRELTEGGEQRRPGPTCGAGGFQPSAQQVQFEGN